MRVEPIDGSATATPEHRRMIAVLGHPGIYRKGSRYLVRWRHHGRLKTRSFRTLTEATKFKAKTASGDTQATSRIPFKRYAEAWLDSYNGRTARGLSDSTRAGYRDALDRFAIPFFGTVPLDRVDPPLLRDFIAHLAAQTANEPKRKPHSGTKRTLAPATVRRYYAPVRALLATAYEDGLLRSNPALGVRVIVKDRRPRTPLWLTADQTRALLAAMPPEDADLAYFLAATGCRISEALRVRWCDVAPDENGRIVLAIPKAKTPAGERVIPLSPETARRLTKRRAGATYAADHDPIFPSSAGTHIDSHNYRRNVFKPAAKAAGVPWATPHKLRHGLASLMANQGYSAAQIAAHLGHADGGVLALKTYIHPDVLDSIEFIDVALA
jgi:integrase